MRSRIVARSLMISTIVALTTVTGASAAPNEQANCWAEQVQPVARDGALGSQVSAFARDTRGIGQFVGPAASSGGCTS